MPGRRHCSLAVEAGGGLYVFDAGEGCSHTAHTMGIDLLAMRAIFISHPHIDHVGGLANLIWTVQKVAGVRKFRPPEDQGRTIHVWIPSLDVWRGVLGVLGWAEGEFAPGFRVAASEYGDGLIHADGAIRVTALHNGHMGEPAAGEPWRSFSFRIEADGRGVVFSGDVRHVSELEPLIGAGCDLLLMETGHHLPEAVCRHVAEAALPIGRLGFVHHGRAILADATGELAKCRAILGERVLIAEDRMIMAL